MLVDESIQEIPGRSALCSLPFLNGGTPYVESPCSYIRRLSFPHSLSPLGLSQYLAGASGPSLNNGNVIPFLLGSRGKKSHDLILKLAADTHQPEVGYAAALIPYFKIFNNSLIRRNAAWCAACFEEWSAEGLPLYEPLIWRIDALKICRRHLVHLQDQCPQCFQQQDFFQASPIGFCEHCSAWLGGVHNEQSLSSATQTEHDYHLWSSKVIGELVQAPFKVYIEDLEENLRRLPMTLWLCYYGSGRVYYWKRHSLTGAPRDWEMKLWRNKFENRRAESVFPQLEGLLKACFLMELTPFRILYWSSSEKRLLDLGYSDDWYVETRAESWSINPLQWPPMSELIARRGRVW